MLAVIAAIAATGRIKAAVSSTCVHRRPGSSAVIWKPCALTTIAWPISIGRFTTRTISSAFAASRLRHAYGRVGQN